MCNVALKDGRFTWRHNSVLYKLYHYISALSSQTNTNVFVDWLGHDSPALFFNSYRPDLLIVSGGKITAIELSICFETNFSKARSYKQNKYKNLKADLCKPCNSFKVIFVEFSTLGVPSKYTSDLVKYLKPHGVNTDRMIKKCMEVCMRASYYIFCRRNKRWTNPDILNFYQI